MRDLSLMLIFIITIIIIFIIAIAVIQLKRKNKLQQVLMNLKKKFKEIYNKLKEKLI